MRAISSVCAMRSVDVIQRLRIAYYRRLWTCDDLIGTPTLLAPALLAGPGQIRFAGRVALGFELSPGFLSGYTYVEARYPGSIVDFGDGTHLNNGVTIVSEGPGISIGSRCLIGTGVLIYDSDFHPLDASARDTEQPERAEVRIGDAVFIGSNAIVLKGTRLGIGSVVGAGAVVTGDVPPGAVVAGNPARVLQA